MEIAFCRRRGRVPGRAPVSAGGARAGTVTIADNATGSPSTIALSGTVMDFSLASYPPSAATVAAGQAATFTLAITPLSGFR